MSGYRIVDGCVLRITDEQEISAIELAASTGNPFEGARLHIDAAIRILSDRNTPDYRNCIKESISAVEAACRILLDNPTITAGKALNIIKTRYNIHQGLITGYSAIYGWTSDEGGIRHGMMDESDLKQEDALYMLVSCSAFVNYLAAKSRT